MRRFLHLVVTLLLLVSGPLSMPGVRVERVTRALADAVESQELAARVARGAIAAKSAAPKTAHPACPGLTEADVGEETTRSLSGKVRSASRSGGGWLGILSQALGDSVQPDGDEIDAADVPGDFDNDGGQPGWALVTFTALHLLGPAATLVEPNLWGIQPAIGHPLGVDEPPRV